jgi:Tfp pilus assembly protein PilX
MVTRTVRCRRPEQEGAHLVKKLLVLLVLVVIGVAVAKKLREAT